MQVFLHKAAQVVAAVQSTIPDRAMRRLVQLRHNPYWQAVGQAASEALAEILSRESGVEDEEPWKKSITVE